MSCSSCNNGSTKSSPCACKDHGLVTPCSYTNCQRKNQTETCEDIQCSACVGWCQNSFCVTNAANQTFCVNKGEKLDFILQKLVLFVANPGCWNSNIAHLFVDTVTNNSIKLMWDGIPTGTTAINVYYATTAGAYVLANTTGPLSAGTTEFDVTGLSSNTAYKFKVAATTGSATCDSVEVYANTIA